jgi:hypothetical protein
MSLKAGSGAKHMVRYVSRKGSQTKSKTYSKFRKRKIRSEDRRRRMVGPGGWARDSNNRSSPYLRLGFMQRM